MKIYINLYGYCNDSETLIAKFTTEYDYLVSGINLHFSNLCKDCKSFHLFLTDDDSNFCKDCDVRLEQIKLDQGDILDSAIRCVLSKDQIYYIRVKYDEINKQLIINEGG